MGVTRTVDRVARPVDRMGRPVADVAPAMVNTSAVVNTTAVVNTPAMMTASATMTAAPERDLHIIGRSISRLCAIRCVGVSRHERQERSYAYRFYES